MAYRRKAGSRRVARRPVRSRTRTRKRVSRTRTRSGGRSGGNTIRLVIQNAPTVAEPGQMVDTSRPVRARF